MIAFLMMVLVASKVRFKAVRIAKMPPALFSRLLLTLSWAGIVSIVLFGGLRYFNLDLSKVYDFRSESAANLPAVYGYISPLISKVLLPFSLLLSVLNRDRVLALSAIFGSVMMLVLTAHKVLVFYPFAVLIMYYMFKRRNVVRALVIGYIAVVLLSLLDFSIGYMDNNLGSLMLRRTYITPAHLNYSYYELFSQLPSLFWSESKITFGLIEYPYDVPSSVLVGREIYGFATLNANTGWIGSGYANGGFMGMLVYAGIIGVLLSFLNGYAPFIPKHIIVSISVPPMLTVFMSSDLPTAFLNHGVILVIFLFSLFTMKKGVALAQASQESGLSPR